MNKQNEQMPVRYKQLGSGQGSDFYFERSLDLIFSPGCFTVEIDHANNDVGLPVEYCGSDHYIVGTLMVTDNGVSNLQLDNRLTGQVLIFTSRNSKETKVYTRTYADGVWCEWSSLARVGMYNNISTTDELLATVYGLVNENIRAKEVEESVKHTAVDISSLSCTADNENVTITGKSMDGEVVHTVEIPVATTEKAGLISAVDKIKVDSVLPFIEDTNHTSASLLVGNANNYNVGTKVTYGTLTDWRTGTFRCIEGQLIKIDTQGGTGVIRPLAFCDKDMVVLQTTGTSDGMLKGALVAPVGTEYIVVNCKAEYVDNFSLEIIGHIADIAHRYEDREGSIDDIVQNFTTYTGTALTRDNLTVGTFYRGDVGAVIEKGRNYQALSLVLRAKNVNKFFLRSNGTDTVAPAIFADANNRVVAKSAKNVNEILSVPDEAEYIYINAYPDTVNEDFELRVDFIPLATTERNGLMSAEDKRKVDSVLPFIEDTNHTSASLLVGNANNYNVGTKVTYGTLTDWRTGTFYCKAGQIVKIDTQGTRGAVRPLAFCDKDMVVLQTTGANDGMLKGVLVAPVGTEYIVVNCNADYEENFLLEIKGELVHAVENYGTPPQIFEQPIRRRSKDEPVRLCFFGNSWHMNTWWYLNKMLHSVGINAEMKCFYVGGSIFSQWVDYYKNNIAVDCWTSVDGADWQTTKLNFADTLKEKWDVIAFQQGAYKALDWNNWSIYNELVSIIKRNCGVDTVIAFNVGWTPPLQNENLAVYGNSPEGQKVWQEIDNHYTLRFMRMSGISNVAPNGATMWSMRRNPQLNVANDMATDALHPDNGLPMYGLAGTWWQTYIAPMFGVDFSEVEWLPSTSTQKATVSGSSWQAISEEQREIIREIVKLSMSDRFGFNEV